MRFRDVRKSYDGLVAALAGFSLDVARGEFITLLGPSGSGKTTVLMTLAGFERPDAGEILLEGRPVGRVPAHRRGLGVVFQSYALFPHMTVAENVAFPLAVRRVGRAEREARVARVLDAVRLGGLAARLPSQLSGGQQQRAALARALVFEPPLVLLDEPLAALDRALREEMQLELRRLHRQLGVTMLYVTHDQAEAMTMSDRIALMEAGTVLQVGTPQALYEEPQSVFAARFIGENNALAGVVAEIDEDAIASVRLGGGQTAEARLAEAAGAEAAGVGERVWVMIRPERIAVSTASAEALGEGVLAAKLLETIHVGDHLRLRVALAPGEGAGGAELTVKRPAAAGTAGLREGATVAIAWQPDHARVFRAVRG